jgi:hypothetical protein
MKTFFSRMTWLPSCLEECSLFGLATIVNNQFLVYLLFCVFLSLSQACGCSNHFAVKGWGFCCCFFVRLKQLCCQKKLANNGETEQTKPCKKEEEEWPSVLSSAC